MSTSENTDQQLVAANARRQKLVSDRRAALAGTDPVERAKWQARDEALTRGFVSPDGGL